MKFFLDNNSSPRISRALRELEDRDENPVVHLREKFTANTKDEEWMRQLGDEGGWVVVTCDTSISRNPHEIKAWLESGLIVFFLKSVITSPSRDSAQRPNIPGEYGLTKTIQCESRALEPRRKSLVPSFRQPIRPVSC